MCPIGLTLGAPGVYHAPRAEAPAFRRPPGRRRLRRGGAARPGRPAGAGDELVGLPAALRRHTTARGCCRTRCARSSPRAAGGPTWCGSRRCPGRPAQHGAEAAAVHRLALADGAGCRWRSTCARRTRAPGDATWHHAALRVRRRGPPRAPRGTRLTLADDGADARLRAGPRGAPCCGSGPQTAAGHGAGRAALGRAHDRRDRRRDRRTVAVLDPARRRRCRRGRGRHCDALVVDDGRPPRPRRFAGWRCSAATRAAPATCWARLACSRPRRPVARPPAAPTHCCAVVTERRSRRAGPLGRDRPRTASSTPTTRPTLTRSTGRTRTERRPPAGSTRWRWCREIGLLASRT